MGDETLRQRRAFARAPWGPATLVDRRFSTSVKVGTGAEITLDARDPRLPSERDAAPAETVVNVGVPVLADGVRIATVVAGRDEVAGFVRPGRLRVEGESPFDLDGLRLRGHVMPQRLTLEDATGRLVWTPPVLGLANLHEIPLLACPPRVADRAAPEHIALWLAAWWKLAGQF